MWKMFVDIYLRKSGKILHIPIWHPVPDCSTLFGIVPIKDAAVAEKIAQDIDLVTKDYPAAFGLEEAVRPFRSIMVDAFCQYIPNGESVWKSMHE